VSDDGLMADGRWFMAILSASSMCFPGYPFVEILDC